MFASRLCGWQFHSISRHARVIARACASSRLRLAALALAVLPLAAGTLHAQSAPATQSSAPAGNGNAPSRSIALTFDDVPMTVVGNDHIPGPLKETQSIDANILRVLKAHHATAIGFVNEVKLNVEGERDARAQILEDWLNAGMLLGNHGYSHVQFSDTTLGGYEDEFIRGDTITVPMLQQHHLPQRWFRHPYLDTGDTAEKKNGFDSFVAAHGYRIAPVTIQIEDWMFNAPYAEARAQHDTKKAALVVSTYLAHTTDQFDYSEKLSQSSFHREIPLVMLMHADLINSENLDAVLTLMEKRGYHFISIDQAMSDPAYSTPDQYVGNEGSSWLDRWQLALGKPMKSAAPQPPDWVQKDYDRITAAPK